MNKSFHKDLVNFLIEGGVICCLNGRMQIKVEALDGFGKGESN